MTIKSTLCAGESVPAVLQKRYQNGAGIFLELKELYMYNGIGTKTNVEIFWFIWVQSMTQINFWFIHCMHTLLMIITYSTFAALTFWLPPTMKVQI